MSAFDGCNLSEWINDVRMGFWGSIMRFLVVINWVLHVVWNRQVARFVPKGMCQIQTQSSREGTPQSPINSDKSCNFKTPYVTLSAKTSLMLGVHKAGFRREGHIICTNLAIRK